MESDLAAYHRKIELQSPEDLSYLLANVRRAATAHIDEAFPPVEDAQGPDELRARIEELVNEYIEKTFTLAAPNLSINGLSIDDKKSLQPYLDGNATSNLSKPAQPEEVYAPFDARLRARVEELTREEEDLLRDIAALKKSVPATAAASWTESVKRGIKEDEEGLVAMKEKISREDSEGKNGSLEIEPLERQEDVEKRYEGAARSLGRLKREMPSVTAKMERARGAGSYVVTEQ